MAEEDLVLAKLFEAHADAGAILGEADVAVRPGLWGVFAAESKDRALRAVGSAGATTVSGAKPWCSGAGTVQHCLVTCVDELGQRRLAAVDLRSPGVAIGTSTWASAGMADCGTADIEFSNTPARFIGGAGFYVDRPGFWQGAIGVAACWFGGVRGVARVVRANCLERSDPHSLAHLGAVDAALHAAASTLARAADQVDANPHASAAQLALATRAVVENTVDDVLRRAARALGASPLCRDAAHAQRVQDLSIFIRQSHAERDLAALGESCLALEPAWEI